MGQINNLVKEVHENAVEKGFHVGAEDIPLALCLIHSEVSEALEADRQDKHTLLPIEVVSIIDHPLGFLDAFQDDIKESFEDELADIVIRVMDLCGAAGIDLENHIIAKIRFNKTRTKMHGGKKY